MKKISMLAVIAVALTLNAGANAGDCVQRVVVQDVPTTATPTCNQAYTAPQAVTVQRVIVQEAPVQYTQRVIVQQHMVQPQRVIVQHHQQRVIVQEHAVQSQRFIAQGGNGRVQRQGIGGGNVLGSLLSPQGVLTIGGAALGASLGGPLGAPAGAAIGAAVGQVVGGGLR